MRIKKCLVLLFSVFCVGCACPKNEVLIPIKCNLKMPLKPVYDGSFESAKSLMVYFLKVEQIAKDCTGE